MSLHDVVQWQQCGQGLEAVDQAWFGLLDATQQNKALWNVLCCFGEHHLRDVDDADDDDKEQEQECLWKTWMMEMDVVRGLRCADDALVMDHLLDRMLSDVHNSTKAASTPTTSETKGRGRREDWTREQQAGCWMRCVCACGAECLRAWKTIWARRCMERVVGVLVTKHSTVFSAHQLRVLCAWQNETRAGGGCGGSSEGDAVCGGGGGKHADRANAFERDVAKWQQLDVPHGKARNTSFF